MLGMMPQTVFGEMGLDEATGFSGVLDKCNNRVGVAADFEGTVLFNENGLTAIPGLERFGQIKHPEIPFPEYVQQPA